MFFVDIRIYVKMHRTALKEDKPPFGNQLLEGVNWKKGPPWNNLTDLDECYQTFLASVRKQ